MMYGGTLSEPRIGWEHLVCQPGESPHHTVVQQEDITMYFYVFGEPF